MRIWFLAFEYPPFFGGGVATYMRYMPKVFADNGDDVLVFALDPKTGAPRMEETQDNVRVIRFRPEGSEIYRYAGYRTALSYHFSEIVAEYIEKEGPPDWIDSSDTFGPAYYCLQRKITLDKRFRNLKFIITTHAPIYILGELDKQLRFRLPEYWHGEMERASIIAADGLVFPSHKIKKTLSRDIDMRNIPNSIIRNPFPIWHQYEEAVNTYPENRAMFHVASRVQYLKGALHLTHLFAKLWDQGMEIPLHFFGQDAFFEPRQTTIADMIKVNFSKYVHRGLIHFHGLLPRSEIFALTRHSYAQIHPSLFENFPYAVVEAMAAGEICLTTRTSGIAEIIRHGTNGFLFDHGDAEGFADTIRLIIELREDERKTIGGRATDTIKGECDPQKTYEERRCLMDQVATEKVNRTSIGFQRGRSLRRNDLQRIGGETNGLLSIVIPYFNLGEYIEETVSSVVDANYKNTEIIIVDDGSTDERSLDALSIISRKYYVKIYHKNNEGVEATRNFGASKAKGEFLAFLDADDVVRGTYYSRAIEILNYYDNVFFVGCWIEDFNERGKVGVFPTFTPELPMILLCNTTNCAALVYRRSAFLRFGMNDVEFDMFIEDWDSTIAMVVHGARGVMIPEPLFGYRARLGSNFRARKGLWTINYERICMKYREAFAEFASEVAAFLNDNGPNTLYTNISVASRLINRDL